MSFEPPKNSDASRAMEQVEALNFTSDSMGSDIGQILDNYHVNPERQVDIIQRLSRQAANRSPDDLQRLAKDAVGRAVADPRIAGAQAKDAVETTQAAAKANGADLTDDELSAATVKAAGDAAAEAGGNRADAEADAQKYLDQGVSPAMAAKAAATVAAARANGFVAGYEIFGYLDAVVQGNVIENNLDTETKTVTDETVWKIGSNFVQVSKNDLTINCRKYHAIADHDFSMAWTAWNTYGSGYQMFCPNFPVIATVSTLYATVATNAAYVSSVGTVIKRYAWPMAGDFYATGLAYTYIGTSQPKFTARREVKGVLVDIYAAPMKLLCPAGGAASFQADEAMKAIKKVGAIAAVALVAGGIAAGVASSDA